MGASSSKTESEASSEAQNYKSLTEVYANTEEIELEDDELYFAAADEPVSYKQASKDKRWREAMEKELDAVE